MHVNTDTSLSAVEINERFASLASRPINADRALYYVAGRNPPKFFLPGPRLTMPAAAEVWVEQKITGAEVILRLMWGPLPAPFPRALAGLALLAACLVLGLSARTTGDLGLSVALALLPLCWLQIQRRGERVLQAEIGHLLGDLQFHSRPH